MDPFCRTLHVVAGVLTICKDLVGISKNKMLVLESISFSKMFHVVYFSFSHDTQQVLAYSMDTLQILTGGYCGEKIK
jgi:hypothetical protein